MEELRVVAAAKGASRHKFDFDVLLLSPSLGLDVNLLFQERERERTQPTVSLQGFDRRTLAGCHGG